MSGWIDPYDWLDFCARFEEMEQQNRVGLCERINLDLSACIDLDVVENSKIVAKIRRSSFTYCDQAYKAEEEEKHETQVLKCLRLIRRDGSIAFELEIGLVDSTINGQRYYIFELFGKRRFLIGNDGGRLEP